MVFSTASGRASSFFQSFMNDMFRDMLYCFMIVYIDDNLIYSKSHTKHVTHVTRILCRLLKHGLYAKAEKFEFHILEISFLSYRSGPDRVKMEGAKVAVVTEWPEPTMGEEEWRHWLEGALHPFSVLTDHRDLEYIWQGKRLNPIQVRWALFFTRFWFTLSYCPGSKNAKADACYPSKKKTQTRSFLLL